MAAPFPRKIRLGKFPTFWQSLQVYWDYFQRFFANLSQSPSSTEFYQKVRGINHQLPQLEPQTWNIERPDDLSVRTSVGLNDGFLTSIPLTGLDPHMEQRILQGLYLDENPYFVLWPTRDWRQHAQLMVDGYLGMQGVEDLRFEFFLPEYKKTSPPPDEAETVPDQQAPAPNAATATQPTPTPPAQVVNEQLPAQPSRQPNQHRAATQQQNAAQPQTPVGNAQSKAKPHSPEFTERATDKFPLPDFSNQSFTMDQNNPQSEEQDPDVDLDADTKTYRIQTPDSNGEQ